jgi:ribonuclease BN (tRNA processing enzyme)
MGAHYRHTTPEMAARVVTAIQARLTVLVHAAEDTLERSRPHLSRSVF